MVYPILAFLRDLVDTQGETVCVVEHNLDLIRGLCDRADRLGNVEFRGANVNVNPTIPIQGGIGGAMDLVAGKRTLIVMMEHRDSQDRPKLARRATMPLTGRACVDIIVTDLTILRRADGVFVLEEVAEGFSPAEVLALTDMDVRLSPALV